MLSPNGATPPRGELQRTTLERACRGYDLKFERALVDEITETIARASLVTDQNVIALRTGEMISALATCLAFALALSPGMDVPSRLREAIEGLAKRIRKDAAKAKAEGLADVFGGGKWSGTA
jgi:hypothetical protein